LLVRNTNEVAVSEIPTGAVAVGVERCSGTDVRYVIWGFFTLKATPKELK
jgi:hypothetical protein